MKSIKPGRGPSMMGGVVGIIMICFGIVWTAVAASYSGIMAIFGVLWTCVAVIITVFNFSNATCKNRYTSFDIVDGTEEPDPLNERFGSAAREERLEKDSPGRFCPYCGAEAAGDFAFCNHCGKKLLDRPQSR